MSNKNIGPAVKNHKPISIKIEEVTFNSIRKILPDKAIEDACLSAGYRHRRRIITPVIPCDTKKCAHFDFGLAPS
jgi:hypothetical protein